MFADFSSQPGKGTRKKRWTRATTPTGGSIWLDSPLTALLEWARGKNHRKILETLPPSWGSRNSVGAALECLTRAGLLPKPEAPPSAAPDPPATGPLVSAILVGFNSRHWLETSLPTLVRQTYAPVEVILVDNGSQDGTADWLPRHYPGIILISLSPGQSLARALNQGIERARGEYFLLLNPDILMDPWAVAAMVAVAEGDDRCAAVAAKLKLSRAPGFLNGLGNYVGSFSWGADWGLGHLDLGQFDDLPEVPSACFAAALIKKKAWEKTGPLDEGFPLYYEDAEWCYRSRLLGWRIRPAPRAVIFHAMGDSGPDHPDRGLTPVKTKGIVYGRLRFVLKLLGRKRFRFLVTYGLEDAVLFFSALIRGRWSRAGAYLAAWHKIVRDLPALQAERRRVQGQRVLSDRELFALQRDIPQTLIWKGLPVLTRDLIDHHYAPLLSKKPPRRDRKRDDMKPTLLIISHDLVDTKMAGPGIRYLEMARALNRLEVAVTLAIPGQTGLTDAGVTLVPYDEQRAEDLRTLSEKNDVVLISGYLINKFPFLETSRSRLVVDLYDPLVLENLHYYQKEPLRTQETLHRRTIELTNTLARIGDFFICGNERQRDYWLGLLTANRRINPLTFDQDPSLRRLIDQVGIGLPDRGPEPCPFLRGIHPLIPLSARIVLWGGGIWNWLDPLTLIEAWPRVTARHPEARLVFLGTRHPNPLVPVHEMARRAEQKAREIGEKDRTILFFDWLSYKDRESLLAEADIGVTLHPVHVETRYSLRTRVLDYIWASLPILITEGDVTSEWVREYRLGETIAPFNAGEAAEGLLRLLDQPKEHWTAHFAPLQARLSWTTVVEPLHRYCLEGSYAPDRLDREKNPDLDPPRELGSLARAAMIWRQEGFKALVYRGWRYLQSRLSRI